MQYEVPDYVEKQALAYRYSIKRLCELMSVDDGVDLKELYDGVINRINELTFLTAPFLTVDESWIYIARMIKEQIVVLKGLDNGKEKI